MSSARTLRSNDEQTPSNNHRKEESSPASMNQDVQSQAPTKTPDHGQAQLAHEAESTAKRLGRVESVSRLGGFGWVWSGMLGFPAARAQGWSGV